MAGRAFNIARTPAGAANVQSLKIKSGETFKKGAVVAVDTNGLLVEAGADPTAYIGVAMQAAFSGPGYNAADTPLVVTGITDEAIVALGNDTQIFSGRGVNGGTDPTTPAVADIGDSYGVLADADGIWTIDLAETTVKVITIVDVDIASKTYFFKFIQENNQFPLTVDNT